MTITPSTLLLDSNVWVDLFLANRPGHDNALRLANRAIEQEISLFIAAISIKDIYYVLESKGKQALRANNIEVTPERTAVINEYAWSCIRSIEDIATVVPLDQSDVWIATKLRPVHNDFEDDLVLAAMERSKADYLVTADETFMKRAPVAALTIDGALALIEA